MAFIKAKKTGILKARLKMIEQSIVGRPNKNTFGNYARRPTANMYLEEVEIVVPYIIK